MVGALEPHVRLCNLDDAPLRQKQLTVGVFAAPREKLSPYYNVNALVPAHWHDDATLDPVQFLVAPDRYDSLYDVALFRLPSDEVLRVLPLVENLLSKSGRRLWLEGEEIESLNLHAMISYSQQKLPFESTLAHWGIRVDPPGVETVTINKLTAKFAGLHLDTIDATRTDHDLTVRARSHVRVSVNLGPGGRAFLYCTRIGIGPQCAAATSDRAFELFTRAAVDRRVIKLRLAPGEAYIANTQAVVHDASTHQERAPAVSLQMVFERRDARATARNDQREGGSG